ncbi:MAG: stage V sporulation protein AB [Eubacteriales bacterium]|nr:stage V sporulation protein AB [Eubacteriales bacterium]
MLQQFFLAFIGLCAGVIVAGGAAGLLIGLSIIPRYAGITHTGSCILLYEDVTMAGIFLGNLAFLFSWDLPGQWFFLLLFGLFSGIFLGGWVMALAEIADVFPVFSRRLKFQEGLPYIILSAAIGKILGSLLYYGKGWFP